MLIYTKHFTQAQTTCLKPQKPIKGMVSLFVLQLKTTNQLTEHNKPLPGEMDIL